MFDEMITADSPQLHAPPKYRVQSVAQNVCYHYVYAYIFIMLNVFPSYS